MQKKIEDLFGVIESAEFDSLINCTGSLTPGLRNIQSSDPVGKLTLLCRNSHKAFSMVLQKLGAYLDYELDEQYVSPWDVQIASLLLVVTTVDPVVGKFASLSVLRHPNLDNLWWAKGAALSFQIDQNLCNSNYKIA